MIVKDLALDDYYCAKCDEPIIAGHDYMFSNDDFDTVYCSEKCVKILKGGTV